MASGLKPDCCAGASADFLAVVAAAAPVSDLEPDLLDFLSDFSLSFLSDLSESFLESLPSLVSVLVVVDTGFWPGATAPPVCWPFVPLPEPEPAPALPEPPLEPEPPLPPGLTAFLTHLAYSVISAVTAALKSYASVQASSVYQPAKV